jgi:alkylation response protein AidB-like acyl-CoA dehydrogenase
MDHQLIDDALAELAAMPAAARSPEHIQSWARLICSAAGAEIADPTPLQASQLELHAATALLARKLAATAYSTEFQIKGKGDPRLTAFIYVREGVGLYGRGYSVEQVLQALNQAAIRCLPVEVM